MIELVLHNKRCSDDPYVDEIFKEEIRTTFITFMSKKKKRIHPCVDVLIKQMDHFILGKNERTRPFQDSQDMANQIQKRCQSLMRAYQQQSTCSFWIFNATWHCKRQFKRLEKNVNQVCHSQLIMALYRENRARRIAMQTWQTEAHSGRAIIDLEKKQEALKDERNTLYALTTQLKSLNQELQKQNTLLLAQTKSDQKNIEQLNVALKDLYAEFKKRDAEHEEKNAALQARLRRLETSLPVVKTCDMFFSHCVSASV
jgi:archaellum component FlaC